MTGSGLTQKMKFIRTITVFDPDSQLPVEVAIYKTEGGGMVGLDSSFLMNTDEPVWSPFDAGVQLEEEESGAALMPCPQCEGDDRDCKYCGGAKVVSHPSWTEWRRQNAPEEGLS